MKFIGIFICFLFLACETPSDKNTTEFKGIEGRRKAKIDSLNQAINEQLKMLNNNDDSVDVKERPEKLLKHIEVLKQKTFKIQTSEGSD